MLQIHNQDEIEKNFNVRTYNPRQNIDDILRLTISNSFNHIKFISARFPSASGILTRSIRKRDIRQGDMWDIRFPRTKFNKGYLVTIRVMCAPGLVWRCRDTWHHFDKSVSRHHPRSGARTLVHSHIRALLLSPRFVHTSTIACTRSTHAQTFINAIPAHTIYLDSVSPLSSNESLHRFLVQATAVGN